VSSTDSKLVILDGAKLLLRARQVYRTHACNARRPHVEPEQDFKIVLVPPRALLYVHTAASNVAHHAAHTVIRQ
jgi:hypothetical protein